MQPEVATKMIAARASRSPAWRRPPSSQVLDLMAALNASVEKEKTVRGEPADVHELPKKTAKKTAAKKTAGRRPRSA
ncbi:hypothetical protein [Streptomyces griseosporeus]|uniref:hypothetical protein n=1 Tax=Streptomyces griseosporeus TaxID=1910 RepID=UPI0019B3D941|nr:hypothetical protein [Streptomyces griseosporeus]GHF36027.1 hypothetical protein GCM10018783_00330 [Streptomyces griseosporeus]